MWKCCVKLVSSCLYFAIAFRMCGLVCWVELLRGCYYFITFLAIFFVHWIVYLNKQVIFYFFYHNVCMQIESKQAVRKYRRVDRAGKWMFLSILSAWMFTQGHNWTSFSTGDVCAMCRQQQSDYLLIIVLGLLSSFSKKPN